MTRTYLLLLLLTGLAFQPLLGQSPSTQSSTKQPVRTSLEVGIRLQKTLNLYTENGITAQFTHHNLAAGRLYLGASYVTSRLGTALHSNAIKQDNWLVSAAYYFRPTWLVQPLVKANIGYFRADYGRGLFDELPRTSPLASPELGLCFCPDFPVKIAGSIGYNLLTGNGVSGPGTLYPVFVQTSVTWTMLK